MLIALLAITALCLLAAGAFIAGLVIDDRDARRADRGVEALIGR